MDVLLLPDRSRPPDPKILEHTMVLALSSPVPETFKYEHIHTR